MNTNRNNTITVSSANEIINLIDGFLNHYAREKFKTIKDCAQALKSVWEPLVFSQKWEIFAKQQQEAVDILDNIITGRFEYFEAEEYMVILNDLFEQTFRAATNVEFG